jgi:hypothetical protein
MVYAAWRVPWYTRRGGPLVAAENKDRKQLYEILAKELKVTAEEVGKQNGLRILDKADDDHWLKLADGRWVQRKSIKRQEGEKKQEPKKEARRRKGDRGQAAARTRGG